MEGKSVIWDPLRKKEVALTPEEQVRQWCIALLSERAGVPMHLMMSEVGFCLGGKRYRADVLVYDRKAHPLMIVECKRPEVEIDGAVLDQALRYNMALDVRYLMITNGNRTFVCRKDGDKAVFLNDLPSYSEM